MIHRPRSPWRHAVVLSVMLVAFTLGRASGGEASLGLIRFTEPDGWKRVDPPPSPDVLMYLAPGATDDKPVAIVVLCSAAQPEPFDFPANFAAAAKLALGGNSATRSSEVVAGRSRQGFETLSQNLVFRPRGAGDATPSVHVRLVAANVQNRLAAFYYLAAGEESFQAHHKAMDALLASTRFEVAASNPGAAAQRSGAPAGAGPGFPPEAEVLRDEQSRGRPGVVSGNVYDSQGRRFNIPGARVTVFVFGTTFEGRNAGYEIEVDEDGHFEQEVPKGLYKLQCQALIPFNGDFIPVELDVIDGKPFDKQQNVMSKGIVKDFALKLSGERTGGAQLYGYNGGQINVADRGDAGAWMLHHYPEGTAVLIEFEPAGPLVDGSRAEAFTLRADVKDLPWTVGFRGIPIANYRASARMLLPDGRSQPLKLTLAVAPRADDWSDSVQVVFGRHTDESGWHFTTVPSLGVTDRP